MKAFSFSLLLLAICLSSSSQIFHTRFNEYPTDIVKTADNGFLISGYSVIHDTTPDFNYNYPVVIKTDFAGDTLWTNLLYQFRGTSMLNEVIEMADSNIL